jgi:hypothetical protein
MRCCCCFVLGCLLLTYVSVYNTYYIYLLRCSHKYTVSVCPHRWYSGSRSPPPPNIIIIIRQAPHSGWWEVYSAPWGPLVSLRCQAQPPPPPPPQVHPAASPTTQLQLLRLP